MISASFFSLLFPSIANIIKNEDNIYIESLHYVLALFVGVLLVAILNLVLPHEHNGSGHHGPYFDIKKAWLFIIAITLHKLPEGLAVGIAYGAKDVVNPLSLLIGIAVHNIPEGLTIAVSLFGAGYSKFKATLFSFLIGLMQPVGAILGLLLVEVDFKIVPYAMVMAGGTMLFVVINEILPETYGQKENKKSSFAVFMGFVFMTYLTMIFHD
jgi:ZIP family zinc transporter